jgi:hypothetical protein
VVGSGERAKKRVGCGERLSQKWLPSSDRFYRMCSTTFSEHIL